MGTHPIFESDFDCLTDLGSDYRNMLGEVWNQITSNRISSTPPSNLEMLRGRPQLGLKRRSLCLTPKLEPLERKKRRKTLIQLPVRDSSSINTENQAVSLRKITSAIMTPSTGDRFDDPIELVNESLENENKENKIQPKTPKREKRICQTPQNTSIRSPNIRTDTIIRSLTKTTPQRRRCSITHNTKRLSFDGLFRRLHSKTETRPISGTKCAL